MTTNRPSTAPIGRRDVPPSRLPVSPFPQVKPEESAVSVIEEFSPPPRILPALGDHPRRPIEPTLRKISEAETVAGPAWSARDLSVDDLTRARLAAAVPVNTRRAYEWAWGCFQAWCTAAGRTALPATPETLAAYVSDRITAGWFPATIEQAIGTIRSRHAKAGHKGFPDTEGALLLLRGYKRDRAQRGVGQRQATPFTAATLHEVIGALDLATPGGRRDQLVLLLGFQMMARRSELAALTVADVADTPDGLEVTVRTSKTDHESQGRVTPLPPQVNPLLDPVRAFQAWRDLVPFGPLLRRLNRDRQLGGPLSAWAVNEIVKAAAVRAGLPDPARYTAHSLRAGGLTDALRRGVPLGIAARHGGWDPESPTVLRYARAADRWKENAMAGAFQ